MILKELKKLNIDKNTVIIYSSDNGFFNGSHGLGSKVLPYEEGARVPMIIYDPRHQKSTTSRRTKKLSGNVDIAATILDLAGVDIPKEYDGVSLMPLLDNPEKAVRETVPIIQVWGPMETHCYTVVSEQHKYIYWFYGANGLKPTEELFDLAKDPYEMKQQINNPEQRPALEAMRKQYDKAVLKWKNEAVDYNNYSKYATLFDRNIPWEKKAPLASKGGKKKKKK